MHPLKTAIDVLVEIQHSLPQTLSVKVNTAQISLPRPLVALNLIEQHCFHFEEG